MEFRKLRRFKQALTDDECEELLKVEKRGFLAVIDPNGYPYNIPINFLYRNGKIYFHCAKDGWKIEGIKKCNRVTFSVIDEGTYVPDRLGLNFKSIVVFGRIGFVEEQEELESILYELGYKYFPDNKDHIDKEVSTTKNRVCIMELTPEHISGKLVNES